MLGEKKEQNNELNKIFRMRVLLHQCTPPLFTLSARAAERLDGPWGNMSHGPFLGPVGLYMTSSSPSPRSARKLGGAEGIETRARTSKEWWTRSDETRGGGGRYVRNVDSTALPPYGLL